MTDPGPFTTITVEKFNQLLAVVRAAEKFIAETEDGVSRELLDAIAALRP